MADNLTDDEKLARFFLNTNPSVYLFDTFEITHPAFAEPLLFVRNSVRPLTAIDENQVSKTYLYFNLTVEKTGLNNNLDYTLKLNVDDVGKVKETLDQLDDEDFLIKPVLTYRRYQSNDLTAPLVMVKLEIARIPQDELSSTIEAEAPRTNTNGTGIRYLPNIFTGLRPFV